MSDQKETSEQTVDRILAAMEFCNVDANTINRLCPYCFKHIKQDLLDLKASLRQEAKEKAL